MCISILSERITAMNISPQYDAQHLQQPETAVPLVTRDTVESGSSFMARHQGTLLKIGTVVTAGYVAFQALNGLIDGFPGSNQDHGHITTEVKHVAPLDLDCMTVMQAEVNGHIRSKLFGLFGGFTADIKTDTETLVCMHKAGVDINEQVDGTTNITIDAARSTVIFTRMDESKRQQTQSNANGISSFGDGIGSQLEALHLPLFGSFDKNEQADIGRELAIRMVNAVDTECTKQLWLPPGSANSDPNIAKLLLPNGSADKSVLEQMYGVAYAQDVARTGRDPKKMKLTIDGIPAFNNTYKSDYHSEFKITKFDQQAACTIPASALEFDIATLTSEAEAK